MADLKGTLSMLRQTRCRDAHEATGADGNAATDRPLPTLRSWRERRDQRAEERLVEDMFSEGLGRPNQRQIRKWTDRELHDWLTSGTLHPVERSMGGARTAAAGSLGRASREGFLDFLRCRRAVCRGDFSERLRTLTTRLGLFLIGFRPFVALGSPGLPPPAGLPFSSIASVSLP